MPVLHKVFEHLLSLLPRCRLYVDPQTHGTTKLICYFSVMQYCLVSKTEKLMVSYSVIVEKLILMDSVHLLFYLMFVYLF